MRTELLLILLSSSSSSPPFCPISQGFSSSTNRPVSARNTSRNMCEVPAVAVFCTECTECTEGFPGVSYKFLLKHFVSNPVAPIMTGTNTL